MKSQVRSAPNSSIHEYFTSEKTTNKLPWIERFDLSELNKKYVAQGISVLDDTVYHTIHKKDKKSVLIVFRKGVEKEKIGKFVVEKEIDFPPEATHTSGLSIFKGLFYSIDYSSNCIYQFDFKELENNLKLRLIKKVKIKKGARSFGSFELVSHKNTDYLIVTSFLKDNRMYVFDFDKFFNQKKGFKEALFFSVKSSFFTQGLHISSDAKKLYHSVNRFGIDFIYELDLKLLMRRKKYQPAVVRSFIAPHKMIEDIAIQGDIMYTSDESTNKLYSADLALGKVVKNFSSKDLSGIKYYEKLLSHRVRVWDFEENTIDAFIEVLETKVKYLEIDLRFSLDDVAYVYHDSYFNNGKQKFRFSEKKWEEIEEYRYKHDDIRISKFLDILKYFSKHKYDGQILALDLKDAGYEEYIFQLIKDFNLLDSVIIFTWTPQIILRFDDIFKKEKGSVPLFFSHVRVDSIFRFFLLPNFLNYKRWHLSFKDFVLIGNSNYKKPLGKREKGYRHVPYFTTLPNTLQRILKRYKGGICVSKKGYFLGDWLLKHYKKNGLKVAVFGAFFGTVKIDTQKKFEFEAQKEWIDIVFMDDIEQMAVNNLEKK